MNSTCVLGKLERAVSIAERVVGKKESLPVLSCVRLEAKKDSLVISATNLETGVEITIPATVKKEGVVAVPVSVLLHTIRAGREGSIEISTDDSGNLLVSGKGGKTTIKAIPHEEFPRISNTNTTNIPIARSILLDGIQAVGYAASQSLIRPELASVCVYTKDSAVVFVATNSFRLAEKTLPNNDSIDFPDILIPIKNALELVHVLANIDTETVRIGVDDSELSVEAENVRFVSRIVDGNFPDYKNIIPKDSVTEATALKEDLLSIFKKARIFSSASQQIGFHVYPSKKRFTTTARNSDVGETSDEVEAALSGEDIDINFNLNYLAECFPAIHSDSVILQFAGTGKPLVIKGVSDQSYLYLVMPLNK